MTFDEAQRQLDLLLARLKSRKLAPQQFAQEVARLRVADQSGRWWQPDPSGRGWLCWNGTSWQPAAPPAMPAREVPRPDAPAQARGPSSAAQEPRAAAPRGGVPRLAIRGEPLMEPRAFLDMARRVPINKRPQSWWDMLSILGGAASGYVWFVYASIRGTPYPTFMAEFLSQHPWMDFLPALVLLLIPVILVLARQQVVRAISPLWSRMHQVPLFAKLAIAGVVFIVVWVTTNRSNPLFSRREGLDYFTPMLMTAIPAVLVWFRKEIDTLLAPLQEFRRKIPKVVLVGVGLALPFLTAFFLYYVVGFSQYPLLWANTVIATLGSYVLVRNPILATSGAGRRLHPGAAVIFFLLCVAPALSADDFLRDPFNFQDGLRTDGIAPILAGVSTAVVTILVNGVEVAQVILQTPGPVPEGEEAVHKRFSVVVNTMDKDGARSTTVKDETGGVYVYAHCEEAGKGRFPAGDPTIQYALLDATDWVTLTDMGTQHGERCAHVALADPAPQSGEPPTSCSVRVSAGVGGGLIATTIQLAVQAKPDLQLEFF
ncbi:MAG: hypothetical protein AB1714_22780 [Acidobacteriota bacterium]